MNLSILNNRDFKYIIFVIIYSYVYIYVIPWVDIKEFTDIDNYLSRIIYLQRGGKERIVTGISVLFDEGLWKFILLKISLFSRASYEEYLYIVSLISLSTYTFYTVKKINPLILLFFFFNPMFIDLIMGQIRIALSFSLLFIAFEINKNKLSIFLVVIAVFIHSASLLLLLIYFLLVKGYSIFSERKYYLYAIFLALILAILLKYGVDIILIAVEDKRANYSSIIKSNSVAYSIFWFLITLILLIKVKIQDSKTNILVAFSMTMMSLFFFSSVIGEYGQRYVAISIPLIIIAINNLPKYYKESTYIMFGFYQMLQLVYWTEFYII